MQFNKKKWEFKKWILECVCTNWIKKCNNRGEKVTEKTGYAKGIL